MTNKLIAIIAILFISLPVLAQVRVSRDATLQDTQTERVEQYAVFREYKGEDKVTYLKEAVRDGEIPSMAFEDVLPTFNAVWVEYGLAYDMEALKRVIKGGQLDVGSFFKEVRTKQLLRGEKVKKL